MTTALAIGVVAVGAVAVRVAGRRHAAVVARLDTLAASGARPAPSWRAAMVAAVARGRAIESVVAVVAPVVGPAWRATLGRRADRQAARRRADELPEVVDLLCLAAQGGANVRLAVELVAPRAPPLAGAALRQASRQAAAGGRLADRLDHLLPVALGPGARSLAAALGAAERYGAPLVPSLERVAFEARLDRRRRAEEAVRRVPVALLFPLVTCILPAFALLTLGPLIGVAVRGALP